MTSVVKPPITWFGGKSKLAKTIIAHFPEHQTFVEPFGGSAAVLLAKTPSKVEIYNDLDGELINMYRVLRDPAQFEQLQLAVECTLYARAEFALAKEPVDDPVERARRFIVRQRMSHGGLGRRWSYCIGDSSAGMSSVVRRWRAGVERLPDVHKRLRGVQIEQDDWQAVMQRYDSSSTLFYLDPPYAPETRVGGGYHHELSSEDHLRLVSQLLSTRGMVVLSGYAHTAYSPLEDAGWVRHDYEVRSYTSDARGHRTECLWLSPSIDSASNEQTPPRPIATQNMRMRQGAYQTHQIRVDATEAKLMNVIQDMRQSQKRVTIASVATVANMSREHLSRKYRHLFGL